MDEEPEQFKLYKTLITEQSYMPSQAVKILVEYYQISDSTAWDVARLYHEQVRREKNGGNHNKQFTYSH
jgi:hypothetical protein